MSSFARKVISWQQRSGRHGLPWQGTRDPYRIWLSEIMLQQTQVAAVIPYYERFLSRFPDIDALAAAGADEVMQLWAGLGYYARARNLHRAAKMVVECHQGRFPRTNEEIRALPGIGRSTAAAIGAFAYGDRLPILDGNVKRVFARHFGVAGDVKSRAVEERLWTLAENALPRSGVEAYTQGLMDLGATICSRTRPACESCPLRNSCVAFVEGRTAMLPEKSARKELPHRQTRLLVLLSQHEVLLERRPAAGIWGGLWCLPEATLEEDIDLLLSSRYGLTRQSTRELDRVEHAFTHYSLSIFPVEVTVRRSTSRVMEPGLIWLGMNEAEGAAIPAPVKRILQTQVRLPA